MKNIVQLDPSIAIELDIDSIGLKEKVTLRFSADANWTDTYEVLVYNSEAKNTVLQPEGLLVTDKVMTWTIEPEAQGIAPRTHFYEIVATQTKRILFRGKLQITK